MSLSYKLILDKRRKKDNGIYPLKIRVYKDGSFKERSLNITLHENEWNDSDQCISLTKASKKVNLLKLQNIKNKIDKALLFNDEISTPEELLSVIKHSKHIKPVSLYDYSQKLIDGLITANRAGTAQAYTDARNSIMKHGGLNIRLTNITHSFLVDYNNAMLSKGIKPNSIAAYLRSIRAIYNHAIKDELVNIDTYPFKHYKIKGQTTISRTLTINELSRLRNFDLSHNDVKSMWRDIFMLSFYLIGMNFTDLLTIKPSNIKNNRVIYRRKKTGKIYSISLHQEAIHLLNKYTYDNSNNNPYLLPFLKHSANPKIQKNRITQIIKTCNNHIKSVATLIKINPSISTYYARYSWANLAKGLGYSKDMIAEALGHEYGNKVTGIYLDDYDSEKIDLMNRSVIESVLKFKIH